MGRFDHLFDRKPLALKEYVLDQVADELARDLRAFPPPLEEWSYPADEVRFREVIERSGKPELSTYRVGCELARLELLRRLEVIDAFFRSGSHNEFLPNALEESTAHFIARFLVESALTFQERSQGKFSRTDLVTLVEKIEERLLQGDRLRLTD